MPSYFAPPVTAGNAVPQPGTVHLRPEIEPLVRLLKNRRVTN
jgi:hypothetical protein